MVLITEEQYKRRTPNSNLKEFEAMNSLDKEAYLNRLSKYYSLFIQYLCKKIKLDEIDQDIDKINIGFTSVPKEEMDLFQYISSEKLNYLFVRNNIYIERLNENGLVFLDNTSEELNEENIEFIENTYPLLICEYLEQKEASLNYGPASSLSFFAPGDNLVIGTRFNELVDSMEKMKFISFLNTSIEVYAGKGGLSVPVSVINYDSFSVNKRLEEEPRNL